jgi:undecaprenyl-diphosphatase
VLASADKQAVLWLASHRVSWLTSVEIALSELGTLGALWVVLAFALTRKVGAAVWTVVVVVTADTVAGLLRDAIDRPRPFVALHRVHVLGLHPRSPSFPSGHSATAFAGAAFLVMVLRRPRALLLFVPAALVAFSRVYLGAHYPSDVFAGAALGLAIGAVAGRAAGRPGWLSFEPLVARLQRRLR